jgi:dihydropteroate synthase
MQVGDLNYTSLWGDIIKYLKGKIQDAGERGIDPLQIMVDPGLGFGKTARDNLRLIRHLRELRILGRPIVTGASRKSFIGHITGGPPSERSEGTAAVVTASIINGTVIFCERANDVYKNSSVSSVG